MFETVQKQSAGEAQPTITVQLVAATQARTVTTTDAAIAEPDSHQEISDRTTPMQVKQKKDDRTESRVTRDLRAEVDAEVDEQRSDAVTENAVLLQRESVASTVPAEQRVLSGEEKQILLSLLHREINARKQYPYLAIRQKRQGRVSLNFLLHPDGRISDIAIIESSRFGVLDRAAQTAVEKVSPFRLASRYLQQTELFNVDIEFRLN